MSDGPTIEQIIAEIQRKVSDLREDAAMTAETRSVSNLDTLVNNLPGEIDRLQERGYVFSGYLKARAEEKREQWQTLRARVEQQIQTEIQRLQGEVQPLDALMSKLSVAAAKPAAAQTLADQIKTRLETVEGNVEAAQERVEALYDALNREANEIKQRLGKFNWYMDMIDEADFELNAAEAIYIVAKGEWVKTGKGKQDPDGLFYLTDQRLVFERKEKEGGFLGFGAKKVQGIEWEVPLSALSKVESEKKGFLGGKDMVHMEFSSGGPGNPTTIEVKGGINANWYAQQLERARDGDIDQERTQEIDPEVLERVSNAPAACENCGAPFTTPITRSMTEIACEYCGTIVRL
jgi:hypothetical protein